MIEKRWAIKDADENILNVFEGEANPDFIGQDFNGVLVTSVEQLPDVNLPDDALTDVEVRRIERDNAFSKTLDIMNPIWYESLSAGQKFRLAAFRQEWLEYPATGVLPATSVSDIFAN